MTVQLKLEVPESGPLVVRCAAAEINRWVGDSGLSESASGRTEKIYLKEWKNPENIIGIRIFLIKLFIKLPILKYHKKKHFGYSKIELKMSPVAKSNLPTLTQILSLQSLNRMIVTKTKKKSIRDPHPRALPVNCEQFDRSSKCTKILVSNVKIR